MLHSEITSNQLPQMAKDRSKLILSFTVDDILEQSL